MRNDPFISLSSAGSESGLEAAVRGLEGGLFPMTSPFGLKTGSVPDWIGAVWMFECVFNSCVGEGVDVRFLTRSENCSNGRMTRVYEVLI